MTTSTQSQAIEDDDPYCPVCGGCGYIDCCGIADFLKNHVAGKTDCANEGLFLKEILEIVNESLNEEMKVSQKTIEKISGVKEVALSTISPQTQSTLMTSNASHPAKQTEQGNKRK